MAGWCDKVNDMPYEIDVEWIVERLSRSQAKRLAVQLPEGMLQYGLYIAKCLEERLEGAEVYLHADQTFGACDLHYGELEASIRPDAIVHVGHSPYPAELAHPGLEPRGAKVVYAPALSKTAVSEDMVSRAVEVLSRRYSARRVSVATTAQHVHIVPRVVDMLTRRGLDVPKPRSLRPYYSEAQVIGCDYRVVRRKDVDAYVYLGGGIFHPLGLYLATLKPVVRIDPYSGMVEDLTPEGEKLYRNRLYHVGRAIGARRWGIIAGLKTGQYRPWLIKRLADKILDRGGEYLLIASEVTTLSQLVAVDNDWFDAFIVTSCPRLPTDDFWSYEKPVLTPGEAFMALDRRLEPYRFPW